MRVHYKNQSDMLFRVMPEAKLILRNLTSQIVKKFVRSESESSLPRLQEVAIIPGPSSYVPRPRVHPVHLRSILILSCDMYLGVSSSVLSETDCLFFR